MIADDKPYECWAVWIEDAVLAKTFPEPFRLFLRRIDALRFQRNMVYCKFNVSVPMRVTVTITPAKKKGAKR